MEGAPERVGRYELLGVLGGGSFATVYRARDPLLGRSIALKLLLPHLVANEADRRRFLAEGRAMAALHHPNIVTVYDVGEAEERPFLAMELVEGRSLAELIPPEGLPLERVTAIVVQLAAALDALHAAGFIHRDVKAANVLLADDGRVVLTDLGIALSSSGSRYTEPGYGMGTAETAAPEQIGGGAVGPAVDVYALGVLTYQMLAGRPPFEGDTARVLYAHAHLPPPSLRTARPGLHEQAYAAVEAALAKDPMRRPPTAGRLAEWLNGAVSHGPLPSGSRLEPRAAVHVGPATGWVGTGDAAREGVLAFSGQGESVVPFQLGRGLTTFRMSFHPERTGSFSMSLWDEGGHELERLVEATGEYAGTTAYMVAEEGGYALVLRGRGEWSVEVAQPDGVAQEAGAHAEGRGDGVAYLHVEAGMRSLHIEHRAWYGGPFHVTLLDEAAGPPDLLAAAPGTYTGVATRRFPRTGTYVAVVRAAGTWSIDVL